MNPPAILVVEDNPTTRKMFRLVIEGEGFVAIEAGTGASALERMASSAAQLVLMDMVLPDMSGFELAKRLRSLPGGSVRIRPPAGERQAAAGDFRRIPDQAGRIRAPHRDHPSVSPPEPAERRAV
jgi:CheY-like chemotaxis protein